MNNIRRACLVLVPLLLTLAGCRQQAALPPPVQPAYVDSGDSEPITTLSTTAGVTMLPDTTGRFGLTQIFDWDGTSHPPLTASQIEGEAPHEDSVWGAYYPQYWNATHSGMLVSRYMLPVEDDYSVSQHNLTWWKTNHPSWILYACDSKGNPTTQLAWSTDGFADVPLDFANTSVVQYQMNLLIPYMKAHGYNTLAADNTDLTNYLKGGNPELGQTYISGYYGCGYYVGSTFHRVFGPGNDPAFISAMVNWVSAASSSLHAAGYKLVINHPLYNPPTNTNEAALLSHADGMVYERGFTDYGKYKTEAASLVSPAITWASYAQSHHVAFFIVDYLCTGWNGTQPFNNNAACPTDPALIPAPQADWALATYALVNQGGAGVYISPQTGQRLSYRTEYATHYGSPCSAYTTLATNVYERKFVSGLVVVNAGTTPYTLHLSTSHTFHDIEKRAVPNPLTVAPADAYVLLTQYGCSA
ncbi:MAG TPA: hypothetical protein VFL13_10330 [Candidatus Baltobacteraceae bacterium]|nr:hypothetical protein [Candidatus Baltobacteraceae bacterium]